MKSNPELEALQDVARRFFDIRAKYISREEEIEGKIYSGSLDFYFEENEFRFEYYDTQEEVLRLVSALGAALCVNQK